MQPRTQEVLTYLDQTRADLEAEIAAVPESLRRRRPAPDRWSIAEIVEHLGLVEGRISGTLRAPLEEARSAGLGPERETAPVVPTLPLQGILDRSKPIVAREGSIPEGRLDTAAAWSVLVARRRELRQLLLAADGLALSEVVIPHPRFGPLNVYQWLVFVGAHEARHTEQLREVAVALRG